MPAAPQIHLQIQSSDTGLRHTTPPQAPRTTTLGPHSSRLPSDSTTLYGTSIELCGHAPHLGARTQTTEHATHALMTESPSPPSPPAPHDQTRAQEGAMPRVGIRPSTTA